MSVAGHQRWLPRMSAIRRRNELMKAAQGQITTSALGGRRGLCASSSAISAVMTVVMRLCGVRASCVAQIVHVDISVGLHPVLIGFDGERPDQAQAALGVRTCARIGSPSDPSLRRSTCWSISRACGAGAAAGEGERRSMFSSTTSSGADSGPTIWIARQRDQP